MKKRLIPLLLVLLFLIGCGPAPAEEPAASPTPEPTATPEPSEAADLPFSLTWEGIEYEGLYTGRLKTGLPEGWGTFDGMSAQRFAFRWEGGWTAGSPTGEGTLAADRYVTQVDGIPAAGSYTGAALAGIPEGEGRFTAVSDRGVGYTYTGDWAGGLMDGQGTLRYEAEGYYARLGTFTAGTWTPTWPEALASLGTCEPCFTLTEEQTAFLEAHPELWEGESHQNYLDSPYKKEYDRSLTLRGIFAQPALLEQPAWMALSALRTIRSYVVDVEGMPPFTVVIAADSTYSYPVEVILPDRIDGLRRGQRFHVYALPLAFGEYTTVLGERQTCLVMVAGDAYFGI